MREGWIETTLGEIADVRDGTHDSPKRSDTGFKLVTSKNIINKKVNLDDTYLISEQDYILINKRSKVDFNDLLISMIGTVGQIARVNFEPDFAIKNVGLVKTKDLIISRYLEIYLTSLVGQNELLKSTSGSTQKFISLNKLRMLRTILPPLDEQKRIVDLFSSVDSYIEALQQQVDNARKSRNAVLHELFTKGGEGWVKGSLSTFCVMIRRGQAPSYTDQKSVMVLNQKCIRNGKINIELSRQTDGEVKHIPEWAFIKNEDSVVNSTGVGTLGRSAYVGELLGPTTVDSHITIVRPNPEKILPPFLGLILNYKENDIEILAAGSSGQTELSRESLGNLILDVPPLAEQKRIVEIISVFDEHRESLELTLTKTQNLCYSLLSDLLSGNHEIPSSYDKLLGVA